MKLKFKIAGIIGLLTAMLLSVGITTVPAQAHASGVRLTGVGTATVDGVMSPGEWDGAGTIDFPDSSLIP